MKLQDTLIRCEFADDRSSVDVVINISTMPPAYASLPKGVELKNDMMLIDLSKLQKATILEMQALVAREYCRQFSAEFDGIANVYYNGKMNKAIPQPSTT